MEPNLEDANFMKGMQDMLGMDEDTVAKVIEKLDSDDLTALTDAIANNDRAAAEQVLRKLETNERVNTLFRGDMEDEAEEEEPPEKHPHRVSDKYNYNFGEDVLVLIKDVDPDTGKTKVLRKDGTVYLPDGPGDTVGVKIDGKSKMIKRSNLRPLKEAVMGMVGVPSLDRMQQLAGIQPATPEIAVPATDAVAAEPNPCQSAQQAMDALETVEQLLPNIRLADLKAIRQKLLALQSAMNEGAVPERARKL